MADNVGTSALGGAATGAAIGSVIPGIGTAIGAAAGGLAGLFGGVLKNRSQKKENEKARDYNTALYHETQSYNTPANQMARLKAAGLSPDLMYQNGAGGLTSPFAGNVAQAANIENPMDAAVASSANVVGISNSIQQQQNENALAASQVEKNNADAAAARANANLSASQTALNEDMLNNLRPEQANALRLQNEYQESNNQIIEEGVKQSQYQTTIQRIEAEYAERIKAAEANKTEQEALEIERKLAVNLYESMANGNNASAAMQRSIAKLNDNELFMLTRTGGGNDIRQDGYIIQAVRNKSDFKDAQQEWTWNSGRAQWMYNFNAATDGALRTIGSATGVATSLKGSALTPNTSQARTYSTVRTIK